MLQIPTDSIHKFLAIFGLALAIASVGFVYKELEKYREIEGQLARLNTEIDFRDMTSKLAVARFEENKKRLLERADSGQGINSAELDQFRGVTDKLKLEAEAYINLVGDAIPKIKELKLVQRYSAYYFLAAGILFGVGALVAAYGFHRWHADSKRGGMDDGHNIGA